MSNINKKTIDEFRDGIFAMNTRRFGKVPELMIKQLYGFDDSTNNAYDLLDNNQKIEVKFSTALRANETKITAKTVIDECLNANLENRAMSSTETAKYIFDWNIQQVKLSEFDVLYYGIFFTDKIEIYKIPSSDIPSKTNYSDGQHRGNKGNEGQFHIMPDNIADHRNRKIKELTYEELYDLFLKNK